jgi:hypothetical protein
MMRYFCSALVFVGGQDIQDPIEFYNEHKVNSVIATMYLILIPRSPNMTHTKQIVGLFYLEDWRTGYGVWDAVK